MGIDRELDSWHPDRINSCPWHSQLTGAAFQWVKTHGVCQRCLKWPDFQHGSREVSADGQHTQRHDGKGPFWCANPEAAWPPNLAALRQTARANGFADLPRI